MSGVTLKNEGENDLVHSEGVLKAKGFGKVSEPVAEKLLRLYAGQVVSVDDIRAALDKAEEKKDDNAAPEDEKKDEISFDIDGKNIDELLLPQLLEYANNLGLEVKAGTRKDDVKAAILAKLKENEEAGKASDE